MSDKGTISTLSIWSDDQKAVVFLFCVQQLSRLGVAVMLGIDRQTVSRRLTSAYEDMQRLRVFGYDVIWENPDGVPQIDPSRVPIEVDEH